MGSNMKWTKEKIELLRLYVESGITYGNIASKFGIGYDAVKHAVTI